jgi:hypothetical protein
MSWSIPTKIEEDFISGKAQYRTFQTGSGGQSILPVPTNAYIVIFGYDFSPAGGGFCAIGDGFPSGSFGNGTGAITNANTRWFETQQISFYTGQDYFPFIHHVNSEITNFVVQTDPVTGTAIIVRPITSIDSTPITRQVYITSSNDVTITHGCILTNTIATTGTIPVTNRTPALLTYGGSGLNVNAQTNFGPAGTPNQFMQPSPKDFQAFALGLLPNGATDQAWARPDATNGLQNAGTILSGVGAIGGVLPNAAAANYFLNLHYALYSSTIPEQRG